MPSGFPNQHFQERDAWGAQVGQNSARLAFAWGDCTSSGWGEHEIEEPIHFGITFVYQPTVAHGWAMKDDDQLVDGRFPRANGGVTRWIRNSHDFYIGAHVLITVATADPLIAAQSLDVEADFTPDPGYDLIHTFTFTGLAMKDIKV